MSAPQFWDLPAVGTMKECNVELIASLEPDLVIMPKKLAEAAQTLTDLGLTVMLVNPEDHASLQEMLSLIATACGEPLRVEQLLSYYSAQMTKLENLMADAEKPTVYMGGNSSYLTAAPGAMYQSSLITLAGGVNAAAALEGNYWTEVSYEAILTYDPDVIVIPSGADYTAEDIRNDAQLSALKAVKNGAIYAMPDGIEEWDSPIPSGILGAMWLASVLHPERYSPETFVSDATGFYENFYGFTPDPTLLK
jgi:iron complex transport system substrate-binding protein